MRYCRAVRASPELTKSVLNSDVAGAKDIPVAEQGKTLATAWHALTQEEKESYQREFVKDLEQYKKDVEAWKSSNSL